MLSDTERKILQVLYNVYINAWHRPDVALLCRLSQRDERQVRDAVRALIKAECLEYGNGMIRVPRSKPKSWLDNRKHRQPPRESIPGGF